MASNAMWVVNVKCVVKGYQECRFGVKEGEEFKVSKKTGEKGCAFMKVILQVVIFQLQVKLQ